MPNPRTNVRFTKVLLDAKVIDELQLKSAAAHMERWGSTLSRAVAELGFAEEETVVEVLAKSLRVPVMQLGNLLKDNGALRALGVDYCEKFLVFPVTLRDRALTLAMADPTDLQVLDDASSMARVRVQPVMAGESQIRAAIAKHYRGRETQPPRRNSMKSMQKADDEPKLEFELAAPPPPQGTPMYAEEKQYDLTPQLQLTTQELERLQAAKATQEKVGQILRTVQMLLAEKGLVPGR